jgi:hypothetical protein
MTLIFVCAELVGNFQSVAMCDQQTIFMKPWGVKAFQSLVEQCPPAMRLCNLGSRNAFFATRRTSDHNLCGSARMNECSNATQLSTVQQSVKTQSPEPSIVPGTSTGVLVPW